MKMMNRFLLMLVVGLIPYSVFAITESAGDVPTSQSAQALQVDQQTLNSKTAWQSSNYKVSSTPSSIKVFGEQVFSGGFSGLRSDTLNQDYQILPGDQIVVRVWGSVEIDRVLPVDTQGNIFIPAIGPVYVQGVAHSQLNQKVKAAIKTIYTGGVNVYTQLKGVQPISVYVTGFVNNPGRYAGTATDSIIYYLNQANGIQTKNGSYRHINLIRKNKQIASLDIYEFLVKGKVPQIQLQEGDTIVVEQRGAMVSVVDTSLNEVLYELKTPQQLGEKLFDYVVLNAGISHVLLKGFNAGGPVTEYVDLNNFKQRIIQDGDQIVFSQDQRGQTILVQLEGTYLGKSNFIVPKNTKLKELLANIQVDQDLTATQNVSIRRKSIVEQQQQSLESSLKRLEQTYLTASSSTAEEASIRVKEAELIMGFVQRAGQVKPNGRLVVASEQGVADVRLQDGDIISLPSKSDSILVSGQVLVPTSLVYQANWSLEDYINKSGGFTEQADEDRIVVIRQSGEVLADAGAMIKPGDEILVLPEVPTKNIQLATSITQIMYQLAIAAKVAFDL